MPAVSSTKYLIMAGWGDAPHLDAKTKAELLESTPKHERDARSRGIPILGSGRIFTVEEELFTVNPFPIPKHWKRISAIDFGWNHPTAGAWLAIDPDTDTVYLYDVYRRSEQPSAVNALAWKQRGDWIPVAWPHDGFQHDKGSGESLKKQYADHGLNMLDAMATHAPDGYDKEGSGGNSVELGLMQMQEAFESGKLKVFRTCQTFFEEYRLYHRKDGKIVKVLDDVISACLHPDTKVITSNGTFKISELVGTEGMVKSINGEMMPYSHCRKTKQNANVVKLTFSDGYEMTCTPDHKIFTADGKWVQAIDSKGFLCHNAVSYSRDKTSCKKSILTVKGLQSLVNIIAVRASFYIGLFGNFITGKYQKAFTYTTLMGIRTITTYQTLKPLMESNTYPNTKKGMAENLFGFMSHKENGQNHQMEKNSFPKWAKGMSIIYGKLKISFVMCVASLLQLKKTVQTNFVQMLVNHLTEEKLAQITLLKNAQIAMRSFLKTSIQKLNVVRSVVRVKLGLLPKQEESTLKVLQVQSVGQSDVYCMEVKGYHAFAVENGAVVHNCRYAWMMKRSAKVHKPTTSTIPLDPDDGFYLR